MVMDFTEQMVAFAAEKVLGTTVVNFNGHEINLAPPWRRVDMRQAILEAIDIDIELNPTAESLQAALEARQIKHKPGMTRGKLIDALIGDFLEPNFIQPTFLCNYPRDISPLAKSIPGNPSVVERFEGFVGGMELCNAFTELNNPLDQEQRFIEMGRAYADDDEEQHPMDDDFVNALSYGMPPAGGFGIGVDRLVMLFTGRRSIREVILFRTCAARMLRVRDNRNHHPARLEIYNKHKKLRANMDEGALIQEALDGDLNAFNRWCCTTRIWLITLPTAYWVSLAQPMMPPRKALFPLI